MTHDPKLEYEKVAALNATSRQAQLEKERLTRRAALRKLGFGVGMAALMALSTDDLARMVAKKLQQSARDNKLANAVAMEFKNSGVAFANPSGPPCQHCHDQRTADHNHCVQAFHDCTACTEPPTSTQVCERENETCRATAISLWQSCVNANCGVGEGGYQTPGPYAVKPCGPIKPPDWG